MSDDIKEIEDLIKWCDVEMIAMSKSASAIFLTDYRRARLIKQYENFKSAGDKLRELKRRLENEEAIYSTFNDREELYIDANAKTEKETQTFQRKG